MDRKLILFALIFFAFSLIAACSSDEGPVCGNTVCSSNEVCEDSVCVLGLFIGGDEETGCEKDDECENNQVCTGPDSDPPGTCIPYLDCDSNSDCQSGLTCDAEGACR